LKLSPIVLMKLLFIMNFGGGGQGGRRPGEKGAGGVWEAGEEGAPAGFPRWWEAGEKGKNLCNIVQYFTIKKCKEAGAKKYRAGTGIKG